MILFCTSNFISNSKRQQYV